MSDHTSRAQVTPTEWFADEFEKRFQELVKQAMREDPRRTETDCGVIDRVSSWACKQLGLTESAMPRKIYAIRKREFATLHVAIADALLDAMNSSMRDAELPVLAGTEGGAREMVDGYCFATEAKMTLMEQRVLARRLYRFSRGVIMASRLDIDEIAAATALGEFLRAFAPEKTKLAEAA